ncbi:hypothetical protein H671_5g14234 [Cricetulus griseus]|nr:hypothetical protein H671_5g14234 [Cricetulus griseus]
MAAVACGWDMLGHDKMAPNVGPENGEDTKDTMKKWTPKKQWTRQRCGHFEEIVVVVELVGEEAPTEKRRKRWPYVDVEFCPFEVCEELQWDFDGHCIESVECFW